MEINILWQQIVQNGKKTMIFILKAIISQLITEVHEKYHVKT